MENEVQTMGMVLGLTLYESDNSLANYSILPALLVILFGALVRKQRVIGIYLDEKTTMGVH